MSSKQEIKWRFVMGRSLSYKVQRAIDDDGSRWLVIVQEETERNPKQLLHIHGGDLRVMLDAIREVGADLYFEPPVRTERMLPLSSPLLRERRAYASWDHGEESLLLALWAQGYRVEELTAIFGRTRVALTTRLEQLGISPGWLREEVFVDI